MPQPLKIIFLNLIFAAFFTHKTFAAIEFNLSNPQTNGEETTFDISITGLTSSSCLDNACYLQAAYTKQGKTQYFGYTKNNNGDWYKYDGSPGKENIKSNFFSFSPQNGDFSGQLTIKIDKEDSDYDGPGTYEIKAWRYSGKSDSSSGASDNTLSIQLTASTPTPTPSPSPTPTKQPSPTPTIKTTQASPYLSKTIVSPSPGVKKASVATNQVLGETKTQKESPSPSPVQQEMENNQKHQNTKMATIFIGSGLIIIGLSVAAFLWYKQSLLSSVSPKGLKKGIKEEDEKNDK